MKGGRRPGAGRPRGSKTKKTSELAKQLAAAGMTPLEYMLKMMRDETIEPARRDEMARASAPYIHPKLASIEHSGKDGEPMQHAVTIRFIKPK